MVGWALPLKSKLNCEVLDEALAFEVRWAVAGDSVVLQLVAKLEAGEYMSFGLSGNEEQNLMVGGDVVVAWLDQETLGGFIQDYFLDAKSQCAGDRGTCPDYRIQPNSESVRLLNAAHVNGYSIVTYQRPLKAHDGLDIPIYTNKSQAVIWAVGPLNSKHEASYHSAKSTSDVLLHFGRSPKWNCPIPATDAAIAMSGNSEATVSEGGSEELEREGDEPQTQKNLTAYKTPPTPAPAPSDNAWEIPAIQCHEPEDGVFYAQMGPTGGKHGYPAITGHVGWGISYYINGLLIPEINVVRGHTYTFVVEGGQDPETPAKYHPFYITDDPIGGYMHKTPQEKAKTQLFAGVEFTKSGDAVPVGLGRLCNWTPDPDQPLADEFASFGAYQRTLTLICDHGEPGVIQWTPDQDTPDTVYYQCFVHRYLGWKINVLDSCDTSSASASAPIPSRLKPDGKSEPTGDTMEMDELQGRPSIRVVTRVKPLFSQPIESNKGNHREHQNSFPQASSNLYSQEIQELTYTTDGNQKHNRPEIFVPPKSSPKFPELPKKNGGQSYLTILGQKNIEEFKAEGNEMNRSNEAVTKPSFENIKDVILKPAVLPMQENHNGVRVDYTGRPPSRGPASTVSRLRPRPIHAIMLHSGPKQGMMMRRPIQSGATRRPVIVKKPVFRLQPRPMLIAHSTPQASILVPARIPIPQKSVSTLFSKKKKTSTINRVKDEEKMPLAVSTGFNPGTLVLESGFKPITPQPVVAEDRISEVDENFNDNLEGVEEYQPGTVDFQQTEWFEPMFIPSPPDQNEQKRKKPFGNGHKKLQKPNQQNRRVVRPFRIRPDNAKLPDVYVQLQQQDPMIAAESLDTYYLTPSDTVHSVSKSGHVVKPVKADTDMRILLTYDGKPVSNSKLVLPVPSKPIKSKLRTSDFISNIPQFGPFRGDVPPPIPENIQLENIPQLRLNDKTQPLHSLSLQLEPRVQNIPAGRQRTQLSLVRHIEELSSSIDTLQPEASDITEDITDSLKPTASEFKEDITTLRSDKTDPGSLDKQ